MNKQKLINTITTIIILGIISLVTVGITLVVVHAIINGFKFILSLIMMLIGC